MTTETGYTDELAIAICVRMADGEPLSKIVKSEGMPSMSTVYRWLKDNPTFAELYSHARVDLAHTWFSHTIEISDEAPLVVEHEGEKVTVRFDAAAVARNRERIHARQWACARLLPRVYGDKLQLGGADDLPPLKAETSMLEVARRMAFVFAAAKAEQADAPDAQLLLGGPQTTTPEPPDLSDYRSMMYPSGRPADADQPTPKRVERAEEVIEDAEVIRWSTNSELPPLGRQSRPQVLHRRP